MLTLELEKPSRWLMIFDNMEAFDGLSSFWPSDLSGSILVTTRHETLAKEFTEFQLSVPHSNQLKDVDSCFTSFNI